MADATVPTSYTPQQAQMVLRFVELKIPGLLATAEKTLRAKGIWPDDDTEEADRG